MLDEQPENRPGVVEKLLREILSWDGTYPLKWGYDLDEFFRTDPALYTAFLGFHIQVWGHTQEDLATTESPQKKLASKGESQNCTAE
jgi:hypothetical protein